MNCADDIVWNGPLSAARIDVPAAHFKNFEQTNYWKRGKSRASKRLRAPSGTPGIAGRIFFRIRSNELLKKKKAIYDHALT